MKPALELKLITIKGTPCIRIDIKREKRLTQHGFGLYLEDVDPKEVKAGKKVVAALMAQPYRPGFRGMEFWPDNRMAFCSLTIPLNDISVPSDAKKWIKDFAK